MHYLHQLHNLPCYHCHFCFTEVAVLSVSITWSFIRFHCTIPVPAPGLHTWIWKSSIEQSSTTSYFTRVVCNIPVFQGNASSLKQVLHSVWQRVDSNWLNTESDTCYHWHYLYSLKVFCNDPWKFHVLVYNGSLVLIHEDRDYRVLTYT